VTGLESASGVSYIPKWTEITITLALIATGFAVFRLAVKYLPIFEDEPSQTAPPLPAAAKGDWQPQLARVAAAKGD
jgi:hypothetical protein